MRDTNKIIKARKGSLDDKVSQLVERKLLTETQARALLMPDFAGRIGFADYELTNNGASIRRIVLEIAKEEAKREHTAHHASARVHGGQCAGARERRAGPSTGIF